MKNITQVSLNWTSIATFERILGHLPKLQKLYAFIPNPEDSHKQLPYMDYKRIVPTIFTTVGHSLVRLDLSRPPRLAHIDDFIQPLRDRSKFPALKVFNIAQLYSTVGGERLERAKLLYATCKASICHGQWTFPRKNLQVDVLEMTELEAGQIKTLYLWLAKNIPLWDGEFLMEEVDSLDLVEVTPKLGAFLKKMETIADSVPLKLRIDSVLPPTKRNPILPIVKKFASCLVQLTVSPSAVEVDAYADGGRLECWLHHQHHAVASHSAGFERVHICHGACPHQEAKFAIVAQSLSRLFHAKWFPARQMGEGFVFSGFWCRVRRSDISSLGGAAKNAAPKPYLSRTIE